MSALEEGKRTNEAASIGQSRSSTLRSSVIQTLVVQGAVVISTFVQFGLISRWRGVEALGEFSLLMRVRGVLEFAVLLILPMALARELAMRSGEGDGGNRRVLVQAALMLGGVCLAFSVAAMLSFPSVTATVLFGRTSYVPWIPAFATLLTGYASCLMVLAIARGLLNFTSVNLLQFLYAAALPIGLILFGRSWSLIQIVTAMGALAGLLAFGFYWKVRPRMRSKPQTQDLTRGGAAALLLRYGTPRLVVIGAMSLQSLALPWLVNRSGDASTLAALNGLIGVVSASSLLVAPLGMVMLPHLSRLIARGERMEAGRQTSRMLVFALIAGGLGSLVVLASIRPVIDVWLGVGIGRHTALLVASAFVVPTFLVLEVMRAPIDSVSAIPWNALTYVGGSAMTIMMFETVHRGLDGSIEVAAAMSLGVGMLVAASISVAIGAYLHRLRNEDRCLRSCVGVWIVGFSLLATGYFWTTSWQQALIGLGCVGVYLLVVVRTAPSWLLELVPARFRATMLVT